MFHSVEGSFTCLITCIVHFHLPVNLKDYKQLLGFMLYLCLLYLEIKHSYFMGQILISYFLTAFLIFDLINYFLSDSETTKNVLILSTYIHLKCNKIEKFTSDLPTLCPRILLSGPAGNAALYICFICVGTSVFFLPN